MSQGSDKDDKDTNPYKGVNLFWDNSSNSRLGVGGIPATDAALRDQGAMTISDALSIADDPSCHGDKLETALDVLADEVRRYQQRDLLSAEAHETHAQAFLEQVRVIMIEAMNLSPEVSPTVFQRVNGLTRDLRELFLENSYRAKHEHAEALRHELADAVLAAIRKAGG